MAKGVITPGREDGRSTRATGRTQQFATRVTAEFHDKLRAVADRDGLKLVEVLEEAVDAYEREQSGGSLMARLELLLTQATPEQRETARELIDKLQAQ